MQKVKKSICMYHGFGFEFRHSYHDAAYLEKSTTTKYNMCYFI